MHRPRGSIAAIRGSFAIATSGRPCRQRHGNKGRSPGPAAPTAGTHSGRSWPYALGMRPRRRESLTRRPAAQPPLIYFVNPALPRYRLGYCLLLVIELVQVLAHRRRQLGYPRRPILAGHTSYPLPDASLFMSSTLGLPKTRSKIALQG